MGSLSDRCSSALGRRRPFIILLSVGVVLGLILVPNGKYFGQLLGDEYPDYSVEPLAPMGRTTFIDSEDSLVSAANLTRSPIALLPSPLPLLPLSQLTPPSSSDDYELASPSPPPHFSNRWGILLTIIGTVLLDFDADACQSPSRAYLLDVTLPGREKFNLWLPS